MKSTSRPSLPVGVLDGDQEADAVAFPLFDKE